MYKASAQKIVKGTILWHYPTSANLLGSFKVIVFKFSMSFATYTDVLEGYNGTIFAFGQTSSGKTHTMEVRQSEAYKIIHASILMVK